jgi:molybdopterin converting factor small subunit
MEVVIRLHGDLCAKAGTSTIKLPIDENETIDTLLMKLGRRHSDLIEAILDPQTGELRSHCNILLNGRRVQQLRGIHTKLKHKDELAIFPSTSEG